MRFPRSGNRIDLAFIAVALIVGAAYVVLLWRQLHYGLEFDESYHLTVIRNLANGAGYIDDGVSFDTSGTQFAPTIAVGPTLLVPSALVWSATGGSLEATRLVPLAFFVAYLAAAFLLIRRWGGRWAAVAAMAAPLLLPVLAPDLLNRSLMPGRFVGETAAAACLTVCVLLMSRRRYFLAGLAGGFAVQAKLNFALPVVVVLAVWTVSFWVARRGGVWRRIGRSALGFVAPTVVFELAALLMLGLSGYSDRIQATRSFLELQTPSWAKSWELVPQKFASLGQLVSGTGVVFVMIAMAALAYSVLIASFTRPTRGQTDWESAVGLAALALAAVSNLLWWYFRAGQMSSRPAVPSVMILLTVLAALSVFAAQQAVRSSPDRLRLLSMGVAATLLGTLVACSGYQGWKMATNVSGEQLLIDQRTAAAVLRTETEWVPVDSFWTNPEMSVLTGLSPEKYQLEKTRVLVFTSLRALVELGQPDAELYLDRCSEIHFRSQNAVVCQPRG